VKPEPDIRFEQYANRGAYHWQEIGRHWIYHNAYTAERYRRVLDAAAPLGGLRVLDYGCGDGALLSWISRAVGEAGEAVGFDPSADARRLAREMLQLRRLKAEVCGSSVELADSSFDCVLCSEVIEHVADVDGLLAEIHRLLKPGGRAIITTPIRLTERPEEPTHLREWFPSEFAALLASGPLRVLRHEQVIPAATPEVFFWRPRFFLRVPVFRILCNLLSIYGEVNALSWLGMRPRLFMTQLVVVERSDKAPKSPAGDLHLKKPPPGLESREDEA
jgi:SAM-dependent methyltransferase